MKKQINVIKMLKMRKVINAMRLIHIINAKEKEIEATETERIKKINNESDCNSNEYNCF